MKIPIIAQYRGVGLHDHQEEARLKVVRADIDDVIAMSSLAALYRYAGDTSKAPEARLLADAKVRAMWELATETRRRRPELSLEELSALTAGLDSTTWRDPLFYCSLVERRATGFHDPDVAGPVKREHPLEVD